MDPFGSTSIFFDFPHDLVATALPQRHKRPAKPPVSFRTRHIPIVYDRPPTPITPSMDGLFGYPPSCYDLRPTLSSASRRSVSGMKKLMPLKLASPPSSAQASPAAESPASFHSASLSKYSSRDNTPVPWMQASKSAPHLGHVNPKRYRETAIYTEPNSPQLARAYFCSADTNCSCGPPELPCMDLCAVQSYTKRLNLNNERLEQFSDGVGAHEEFSSTDSDDEASVSTAPTSLPSARFSGSSELSIKCRGLRSAVDGASYHNLSAIPQLAEAFEEIRSPVRASTKLDNITDGETSRCSSRCSVPEIAEALATPLAAARPQVVKVRSPETPVYFPPRTSSLSRTRAKAITPPGWASRRMTTLDAQPVTPENATPQVTPKKRKVRPAALEVEIPSIPRGIAPHKTRRSVTPLMSPFQEALNYTKSVPRYKFEVHDIADEVLAIPLIESICDTIDGSPRDLQLDSYCVAEVRRLNRQARAASSQAATSAAPPFLDPFTPDEPKRASRRSKSIFGTFRIPRTSQSFAPRVSVPPTSLRFSKSTPVGLTTESKAPDMSSLRAIFPDSDDWWRSVLYAHLVAYNYVSQKQCHAADSRSSHLQGSSSKATRTLGLSLEASLPGLTAATCPVPERNLDESFEVILAALASCISRIINIMRGVGDYKNALERITAAGRRGYEKRKNEVDLPFVRALAEIVKVAELGAGTTH